MKSIIIRTICLSLVVFLTACGGAEERKVKYLEKGKQYLEENNYEKAKVEFKNVLQIDPKFAEGYYYMGKIEEHRKDLRKALGNYQKSVELKPDYLDAKANIAKIYTFVGTKEYIDKANKEIKEILQKKPDHVMAMLVAATLDAKAGNKQKAIEKLKSIIAKSPDEKDAYSLMASIYLSQKNEQQAISTLEMGIKNSPDAINLRISLAKLYARNSDTYDKAEKLIQDVVALKPDEFKYRVALATFYATSGQKDKAEATLRKAIQENDEEPVRYLVLTEYFAKTKGAAAAEQELIKAIKQKPDMFELRFALVELYKKLNLHDKAKGVLQDIIKLEDISPNGLNARNKLAEIYLGESNINEAQKYIEQVLKESPADNDALFLKGKIAYLLNDDQTVINSIRTVVKNNPKDPDAALLLAQAHERSNQSDLAKSVLLSALEADPLNPKNHLNYANYLASKKQLDEASQTLDKALAYFNGDLDLMKAKLKVLVAEKKLDEVPDLLDMMKKTHPTDEDVYMIRGQYKLAQKKLDDALVEYESAYKYSSTKFKPLETIVKILVNQGEKAEAISRLNKLASDKPYASIAHELLGQIYIQQGNRSEGIKEFELAMDNSQWELPYISAGTAYLADNKLDKALAILKTGLAKVGNKVPLQFQLAGIYEKQKQYDNAKAVYEKILSGNPANRLATNNLVSLLVDYGNGNSDIKRAADLASTLENSNNIAFQDTLAWVSLKNGNATKALSIMEGVVAKAPNVPIFEYHMGMAYYQSGNRDKAREMLQKSVDGKGDFPGKDKAKQLLLTL